MSQAQWESIYLSAWKIFYTPDHIETILRRAAAFDVGVSHLASHLWIFSKAVEIEQMHPLQTGIFRRRYRRDRRYGMPVEPVWSFYPKRLWEIVSKNAKLAWAYYKIDSKLRGVRKSAKRHEYMDAALAPVVDDETETLELFTHNEGARNEVVRTRKIAELTGGGVKSLADA
jgi:hypothetical protein